MSRLHLEHHFTSRVGWLRASVLGANDGILSTASLIVGVAAAHSSQTNILIAGLAGLLAGAMSMAAGEYVSVSSQADSESSDLKREAIEQITNPKFEHQELIDIYISRGLAPKLANQVALQLMKADPLAAHARDELGITESIKANPIQAAIVSAGSFSAGAALPLLAVYLSNPDFLIPIVSISSVLILTCLGLISAKIGGSNPIKGATRVAFWGVLALIVTSTIGSLFGV